MAEFMTFTPEQQQEYNAWVASRPPEIQAMIRKLPPNRLYRNKKSGHRMCILSYSEDGTVTATVSGKFNRCCFERNVFGIHVDDLEECDLPKPDEKVGAILTDPADVEAFVDVIRPVILAGRKHGTDS